MHSPTRPVSRFAGALARGPATSAATARELRLRTDAVRRHLTRLARVGIVAVEADRRTYRLQAEGLRAAAAAAGPARDPGLALGAADEEEESVLRQYFRGGRLVEVPVKRAKRLVVLQRLALEFEVGAHYQEREVNEVLRRFNPDVAALRRTWWTSRSCPAITATTGAPAGASTSEPGCRAHG